MTTKTDKPADYKSAASSNPVLERLIEITDQSRSRTQRIFDLKIDLAHLDKLREAVETTLNILDAKILQTVQDERTEDGKKVFSNEAAQKAEAFLRLHSDEKAGIVLLDASDLTSKMDRLRAEIDYLCRLDKWAVIEAEYLTCSVGQRGGRL
jgi:hypothetical protein